jgi:transposase-like protein
MKRRQWTSQQKVKIVLEGLGGRPIGEICNQYEISQAQYYQWRERFLANANKAFESVEQDRGVERLKRENQKLKHMVADLSLELKKSDEVLSW